MKIPKSPQLLIAVKYYLKAIPSTNLQSSPIFMYMQNIRQFHLKACNGFGSVKADKSQGVSHHQIAFPSLITK